MGAYALYVYTSLAITLVVLLSLGLKTVCDYRKAHKG